MKSTNLEWRRGPLAWIVAALLLLCACSPAAERTAPDSESATLVNDAIQVTGLGDLFVMQIAYDEADLPAGVGEESLKLLVFDDAQGTWSDAILLNSDAGAGGTFFAGAYADYLLADADGLPDLSIFGVDAAPDREVALRSLDRLKGIVGDEG